jgi:hypothetical protein
MNLIIVMYTPTTKVIARYIEFEGKQKGHLSESPGFGNIITIHEVLSLD